MAGRARWRMPVSAVLLAAFSGCAGDAPEANPDATATPGTSALSVPVPQWNVTDWWTYRIGGEPITFIVSEDRGSDWLMDTSSESLAFDEAYGQFDPEDDFSQLGLIRKSDLAGSEQGNRVQHFRFPLEPNATWTTLWDGAQRTIIANPESETTWVLEAREEGRLAVRYTYDLEAHWIGGMVFFDENETEVFRFDLEDYGSAFSGQVAHWTLQEVALLTHEAGPTAESQTFEVPADITDVWIRLEGGCEAPGVYEFGVGPPQNAPTMQGDGFEAAGPCPDFVDVEESIGKEPPGTWGYAMSGSATDFNYELHILFRYLELVDL